jgi:hypothetical protein
MYMYVCIDICVYTYFCTHHVHSAPVSEQMNKLQRTTAQCSSLSASAAVALVCCTARANLSLIRCACIPSAAVSCKKQPNASASFGEKTGFKKIKIHILFFGGALGWIGSGDMSIFLSTNQSNSWEKKFPGRG